MGDSSFQVLSLVSGPRSFPRGYTSPSQGGVLQFQPEGYSRTGVPQPGLGCPLTVSGVLPNQDWDTTQPVPLAGTGIPPPAWTGVPPEREQESEYLLYSGQYASCGHARGFLVFNLFLNLEVKKHKQQFFTSRNISRSPILPSHTVCICGAVHAGLLQCSCVLAVQEEILCS